MKLTFREILNFNKHYFNKNKTPHEVTHNYIIYSILKKLEEEES